MNVKPVRQRSVLVRLAKIHKAQKRAAKAAAAEAKAAARAAQGTDEFVKTGLKAPKFKKWAIGVAAALGAAGAITAGAIFSRPKTYDAPLEARQRAYAEYRGYTQSEADFLASDYISRTQTFHEQYASNGQKDLDVLAFTDILKDHGLKEAADKAIKNFPYFSSNSDGSNKKEMLNEKLVYLRDNMMTKEYQKFVKNMESDNEFDSPYYNNVLCQYTADSIAFRKYLDKTGIANNSGVMRDFKNICKAIKPRHDDYDDCYDFDSYKPFWGINKDELLERARFPYKFFK